jgi:hypothetical protein
VLESVIDKAGLGPVEAALLAPEAPAAPGRGRAAAPAEPGEGAAPRAHARRPRRRN